MYTAKGAFDRSLVSKAAWQAWPSLVVAPKWKVLFLGEKAIPTAQNKNNNNKKIIDFFSRGWRDGGKILGQMGDV